MFNRSDINVIYRRKKVDPVDQRDVWTIWAAVFTGREPERRLLGRNQSLWAQSSWRNKLQGQTEVKLNSFHTFLYSYLQSAFNIQVWLHENSGRNGSIS